MGLFKVEVAISVILKKKFLGVGCETPHVRRATARRIRKKWRPWISMYRKNDRNHGGVVAWYIVMCVQTDVYTAAMGSLIELVQAVDHTPPATFRPFGIYIICTLTKALR